MRQTILALSTLVLLAGCGGGEPSEADMKGAVVSYFATHAGVSNITVEGFKKASCKPNEAMKGYDCDFNFTISADGEKLTSDRDGFFSRGENGWVAKL